MAQRVQRKTSQVELFLGFCKRRRNPLMDVAGGVKSLLTHWQGGVAREL